SVQAQIINLLTQLQRVHGLTYLFISHDLGVVQHISDRIAVMYLGEIVEEGPTDAVFRSPRHPYTQALLAATPQPDPTHTRTRQPLTGAVPSIAAPPSGCRFHTRCPVAVARCQVDAPVMVATGNGQRAACHLLEDG
ncbi:MAG: ABC transporter ATP-binding protein, partial [Caldilineaceae bacterium]|nr:ABC transporter ATP-binding protein [Caldilineaceae bacterium]